MPKALQVTAPDGNTEHYSNVLSAARATKLDRAAVTTALMYAMPICGYRFKWVEVERKAGRPRGIFSQAKNVKIRIDPSLYEKVVAQAVNEGITADTAFVALLEHAINEHFAALEA